DDRAYGFELTQAPISRLALIQLGESAYELVWSCHHLLLDGWSGALVFNQVFDIYGALQQGQSPSPQTVPTYQSYVRWLKQQDEAAAAAFWQQELKGVTEPTGLPIQDTVHGASHVDPPKSGDFESSLSTDAAQETSPSIVFSPEVTAEMQAFLRSHRLTLNTLIQGIWVILLRGYSGKSDVLFGATVSGRQGELAGIESIVGLLINVLPVRVNVTPQTTIV
ncbi:MAG: condensation domain-containing protein, partial [Cyanobacteria bacterium J06642_11]